MKMSPAYSMTYDSVSIKQISSEFNFNNSNKSIKNIILNILLSILVNILL